LCRSTSVAHRPRGRDTKPVTLFQRLADLDASVARKWPWLEDKSPTATLRLIVIFQVVAVVEIFVGVGTGNDLITGLAAGPLTLGIVASWGLLYAPERIP
jgi:hypothetical protein